MFTKEEMREALKEKFQTDPAFAAMGAAIQALTAAGQNLEERVEAVSFIADSTDTKVNSLAMDLEVIKAGGQQ